MNLPTFQDMRRSCAQRVAELRAAGADTAAAEAVELVGAVERAEQVPAVSGTDGAWYALQALRMLEGNPSGAAVDLAAHYRKLLDARTDVESKLHRIYDPPEKNKRREEREGTDR